MDKLRLLAEFEERANREGLENDAFRLFLLLLANYDTGNRYGEIRVGAVAAAFGERFSLGGFRRACLRLTCLGVIELISSDSNGNGSEESVMIYHIPLGL
jgi:hypothetical protein